MKHTHILALVAVAAVAYLIGRGHGASMAAANSAAQAGTASLPVSGLEWLDWQSGAPS